MRLKSRDCKRPLPPESQLHTHTPHAALLSSRCAGWLLHRLSTRLPLSVLSSRRFASLCLVAPAGCRAIISCRPLVAPPSRPLILSSCWLVVALPVLVPPSRPLVVVHHPRHQKPSNAVAAIEHHRHRRHCTSFLSSTAAIAAVHRHRRTPTPTFVHHRCQMLTPAVATRHR